VVAQYDDEGELITSEKEELRFREARAGEHMMTPFQCDVCHFRNIYLRDPDPQALMEVETMEFMRQAILDSFWSRERTMV
jgi:hypothetical protein